MYNVDVPQYVYETLITITPSSSSVLFVDGVEVTHADVSCSTSCIRVTTTNR